VHPPACAIGISALTEATVLPQVHGSHSQGLQVHPPPCATGISALTEATVLPQVHGSHSQGLQVHPPPCTTGISSLTWTAVAIMYVVPPVLGNCEMKGRH
jgi:hypothetical protein